MATVRRNYIDIVKGVSILTLVFLHFEQGYIETNYNFFIVRSPAFYMVIGWLWGMSSTKRTLKEHWSRRYKSLILPYVWFSLIFILIDLIFVLTNLVEPFILWRDIYKTLCLRGIGTLWFLPSLLFGESLFIIARDGNNKTRALILLFVFVSIFMLKKVLGYIDDGTLRNIINAPLQVISRSAMATLFISIAYVLSERFSSKILSLNKICHFAIGLLGLILSFFVWNFCSSIFGTFHYIISSFMSGAFMIILAMSIENLLIMKPIIYFGRNSLILMALHYSLLYEIARIYDRFTNGNSDYSGGQTIIYFIISMFVMVGLIEFVNRKAKFLIGR